MSATTRAPCDNSDGTAWPRSDWVFRYWQSSPCSAALRRMPTIEGQWLKSHDARPRRYRSLLLVTAARGGTPAHCGVVLHRRLHRVFGRLGCGCADCRKRFRRTLPLLPHQGGLEAISHAKLLHDVGHVVLDGFFS